MSTVESEVPWTRERAGEVGGEEKLMKQEILSCDCILHGRRQKQRGAIVMRTDNSLKCQVSLQELPKIASDRLRRG